MSEEFVWGVYIIGFLMKWFEKWVVVQHYSKRPRLFKVAGPSGALIILGWVQMVFAFILIALTHPILFTVALAFATAVILKVLTVFYFQREINYWEKKYSSAGQEPETTEKGYQTFHAFSYVEAIRRSPIGKPDDPCND